nr:hypothetical protein [Candidatus Delongbacteria bacterium]
MPNDARPMRLWRIVRSAILCWMLMGNLFGTEARIIVDGFFQDWTTITPTLTLIDPAGDFYNDSLDLLELKLSHDSLYLYLDFRLNCEFNLQNKNGLVLYIDTDHQSATGKQAGLVGAELEWRFGDRIGYWHQPGDSIRLYHEMIGLISAPTVTSNRFELAIRRGISTQPDNGIPMGDSIRISLISRGDRLPDGVSGITYSLTPTTSPSYELPDLAKTDSLHLRIVTYNCLQDSLFNPTKQSHFQRILQAIDPDIIGFQEIYDHSAEETRVLLESWLSGPRYGARIDPDLILISRYPILESLPIGTNAAFLVDIHPRSEL